MSIEVIEEIYDIDTIFRDKKDLLYIRLKFKPYINDDDKEFFYRLGIRKIAFYDGYNFNYILDGKINSIGDNYKHYKYGLNSVFSKSMDIRFMKINKREGNVFNGNPWGKPL